MIARRHEGIPISSGQAPARRHERGFSLIEVLMAIVILGIGLISIAALFPAGIAQQRKSVDDVMGPVVANNALAILRNKLRAEDFGFLPAALTETIEGDFGWRRPAFFTKNAILAGGIEVPTGSISIFDDTINNTTDSELALPVLWNTDPDFYGFTPPKIIINQFERYYPMGSVDNPFPPKPQYVWECMFRRFQGRVQVAIFVYRVAIPGGGTSTYNVAPKPPPNHDEPPLPIRVVLGGSAWDADIVEIPNTYPTDPYDPSDQAQGWQAPGQWILDQNNNIHRVLAGRRNLNDGPVELLRPVPAMLRVAVYLLDQTAPDPTTDNVVSDIWYIPPIDLDGLSLSPVYVTVREL